jgi:hypothetical protein
MALIHALIVVTLALPASASRSGVETTQSFPLRPHPRFSLPNNDAITKVRVSAISKTNQVRARLTIL